MNLPKRKDVHFGKKKVWWIQDDGTKWSRYRMNNKETDEFLWLLLEKSVKYDAEQTENSKEIIRLLMYSASSNGAVK